MSNLGADFARALADEDSNRILDLFHPEIVFRGMTLNYLEPRDGRIGWMRVLCAGYRPAG
jgi:hypothetical protein